MLFRSLLTGEAGVGKEVICNLIHSNSKRKDQAFIKSNCSALSASAFKEALLGSDLTMGYLELAEGGTLLIDEIAELSSDLQDLLLDILEKGLHDIRLITTTNKDIENLVNEGHFSQALYNRLNVTQIAIPPLRERPEDIIPLAEFFLEDFCKSYGLKFTFSTECIDCFNTYAWPGNMRELKNLVENLVVSTSGTEIGVRQLPYHMLENTPYLPKEENHFNLSSDLPLNEALSEVEKQLIEDAIIKHGSLRKAAKILEVSHSTLSRKLNK